VASVPLKIWSYNHNSASYAMDIVIAYLAVFRLTPGYAHQRFFLRHPFPPLPCLSKGNIVGCFGNSVKE